MFSYTPKPSRRPGHAESNLLSVTLVTNIYIEVPLYSPQKEEVTQKMATIQQNDPSFPLNGSYVDLNMELTNNDSGAVYDSGTVSTLNSFAGQLQTLPANQAKSISEIIGEWDLDIQSQGVHNGWNANYDAAGQIGLSHAGRNYDQWNTGGTMSVTAGIPTSQLELDGILGYNPATDARIVIGVDSNPNAFVGNNGGVSWSAPGNNYHVVLACSPKLDPGVMRVSTAKIGKEILDEQTKATKSGSDHSGLA